MQFIWTESDVSGNEAKVGIIIAPRPGGEKYILGYIPTLNANRHCLISLRDGMVCKAMTAAEMVIHLNATSSVPVVDFQRAEKRLS